MTYITYTLTPKGGYSTKYTGADRALAEKAYNKLVGKPRQLNCQAAGKSYQTNILNDGMSI